MSTVASVAATARRLLKHLWNKALAQMICVGPPLTSSLGRR